MQLMNESNPVAPERDLFENPFFVSLSGFKWSNSKLESPVLLFKEAGPKEKTTNLSGKVRLQWQSQISREVLLQLCLAIVSAT